MKSANMYLILLGVMFLHLLFPIHVMHGEAKEETDLLMDVTPETTLFDIENMKPGDWAPRSITVENNGNIHFMYDMHMENNGEEKLFNVLFMEITDGHSELYNGTLADFSSLTGREVLSGDEENIQITIRFPEDLGNNYQGLDMHFTLIFTAEAKDGMRDEIIVDSKVGTDGDGQQGGALLPNTATNVFNFILVGGLFLIFATIIMLYHKKIQH